MATRDEVSTLESDVMSVEVEDEPQDSPTTEPVEAEPQATLEAPTEAPADSPELAEAPPPWQPPEGGSPFAFRVDGREVPVEGALRYDHGIYLPAQSWDGVQRYLADREAFNQRIQTLQQQYEERDPARHIDVLRAQAMTRNLLGLMQQGPEKVAEWLDQFQVNAPLFQVQAERDALAAQLAARNSQVTEHSQAEARRQLDAQMPGHFKQTLEAVIQQMPEFKDLKADALFDELSPLMKRLYVEKDGEWNVDPELLVPLLKKEAKRVAEIKRLEQAAKVNKAAVNRPVTPTVATRGSPIPGKPSKQYPPGDRSWKDALHDMPVEE